MHIKIRDHEKEYTVEINIISRGEAPKDDHCPLCTKRIGVLDSLTSTYCEGGNPQHSISHSACLQQGPFLELVQKIHFREDKI